MKFYVILFFISNAFSMSKSLDSLPGPKPVFTKEDTRSVAEIYIDSIKGTYKPGIYDGVTEPKKLPDLMENRKTLLGIDSNNDGVRDDIEIYINRHFENDYDREIYKQFFRRGSHYFRNGKKMTLEQLQNEIDGFHQDLECDRYIAEFGYLKNVEESRNRTFNEYGLLFDTDARSKFLDEDTRKIRSSGSGVGTGAEAYKYCPASIKKKYPMKKKVK